MTINQTITVTGSQKTGGPGVYFVMTPGVTLTLETWAHWANSAQAIIVKDMTGAAFPNITVAAPDGTTIDGAATITLDNQGEALTFHPYRDGKSWAVTA